MARIFINYRRQDSEGYAGRLYDRLLDHYAESDIFMDVQNIEAGADFVQVLENAIAACDVILVMIGNLWLDSKDAAGERRLEQWNDFVRIEIESAIKLNKVVMPVLVGRAKMPNPQGLPESLQALARRNAIELSHANFKQDVGRLVAAIKQASPANESFKKQGDTPLRREKAEKLKVVRADLVSASDSPLYQWRTEQRYFPVIGDGNPDANLMFIGESPGKEEVKTGKPFTGASGNLLNELLAEIGLAREDVYITNIVLDHVPDKPQKRTPTSEELRYYEPFVDRIIEIIRPAVILPLGKFAMDYLLKKLHLPENGGKISQLHGKLIKATMPYGDIHLVPMYHPAVALHKPSEKTTLRADFQKLSLFV